MNKIDCICGGNLEMDFEESRKNGIQAVYTCMKCGKMFVLKIIGEKPRGWMTKEKLARQKIIQSIPF